MIDDLSLDPKAVIREILAGRAVPASEFRKEAYKRGVPYRTLLRVAKEMGVRVRKIGRPGEGCWVWELTTPEDNGIVTKPRRKGYYAHFLFHGKEIQDKLADDLETARIRIAEIRRQLEEERLKNPPVKQSQDLAFRIIKASPKPLHVQLREVARQCLERDHSDLAKKLIRLSRIARDLAQSTAPKETTPCQNPEP